MIYKTCQCGKAESWSSGMPYYDCQGCKECGTTFGSTVMEDGKPVTKFKPLKEHEFIIRYNTNTGKPYKMCKWCYHIDKESYKEAQKPNE